MIDDVTMHATLTSYSLTVMCHFKSPPPPPPTKKKATTQHLRFYCREVESTRNSKLWRLSGRFQTLIWRPGDTVQNLESPVLSGRVDSPVCTILAICESALTKNGAHVKVKIKEALR